MYFSIQSLNQAILSKLSLCRNPQTLTNSLMKRRWLETTYRKKRRNTFVPYLKKDGRKRRKLPKKVCRTLNFYWKVRVAQVWTLRLCPKQLPERNLPLSRTQRRRIKKSIQSLFWNSTLVQVSLGLIITPQSLKWRSQSSKDFNRSSTCTSKTILILMVHAHSGFTLVFLT